MPVTDVSDALFGHLKLNEPEEHSSSSSREAPSPSEFLREPRTQDLTGERADVDAHVEEREPCIASRTAFGIKLAHQRGHVGLQQSGTGGHNEQPEVKRNSRRQAQHHVTSGDDNAAPPHSALRPHDPVTRPSAGQRHDVNQRRVESVDGCRLLVAQLHAGDLVRHVEREQRTHPVVAHALPHLGEKERHQTARMSRVVSHRGALNKCLTRKSIRSRDPTGDSAAP